VYGQNHKYKTGNRREQTSLPVQHSDNKGVDLTGLLGDIKEDWGLGDGSPPSGSRGRSPVGGLGDELPQKLKLFLRNYT